MGEQSPSSTHEPRAASVSRLRKGSKLVRPLLALHLFDDALVCACVVNCLVLFAA